MSTKFFYVCMVGLALSMFSCNSNPIEGLSEEDSISDTYATGTGLGQPTDSIANPGVPDMPNPDIPNPGEPYTPDLDSINPEIIYPPKPYPGEPGFPDGEPVLPPLPPLTDLNLAFPVDSIISFNITTGEIVLADFIFKKLVIPNDEGVYRSLSIYSSEEAIYSNQKALLEDIRVVGPHDSRSFDLELYIDFENYDGNLSLTENYLKNSKLYLRNKDTTQQYKTEWDILIKYLTDSGRIVR